MNRAGTARSLELSFLHDAKERWPQLRRNDRDGRGNIPGPSRRQLSKDKHQGNRAAFESGTAERTTPNLREAHLSKIITHNHNNDGVDRPGFLNCMAWAGSGVLWTLAGGTLTSEAFGQTKMKEAKGELHFVQIRDSPWAALD